MKKNAFYAQSGGVTSVINATAAALILESKKHKSKIGKVYAGKNGILGALNEELIDTSKESISAIKSLRSRPGGVFGSCRVKLKSLEENKKEYERLVEVFKAHNIGYFFYNGGNDSADTAFKVSQISKKLGYPINCIAIPKTVDNDLAVTDCCPGFGSAAKYIATSTLEASLDVASMSETSTKVFILEVMGRHAGWLAASAGIIKMNAGDPPHLILFPEIEFKQSDFLKKVKDVIDKYGYCVIVASEGIKSKNKFISDSGLKDSFGHAQLGGVAPVLSNIITSKLNIKVHWAVSDYLQRSARHLASKVDVQQAYTLGKSGIEYAKKNISDVMLTIERVADKSKFKWKVSHAPLDKVANLEKMLPKNFIKANGYEITKSCMSYITDLTQGEDYPTYTDGFPRYANLNCKTIKKKLKKFNL